jgi:hypothetical protein
MATSPFVQRTHIESQSCFRRISTWGPPRATDTSSMDKVSHSAIGQCEHRKNAVLFMLPRWANANPVAKANAVQPICGRSFS